MEIDTKEQDRLYTDLVWTWPIISPWEDYIEETESFVKQLKRSSSCQIQRVLNMGCGGGHNDKTLKEHFQVTGLDLSEGMLNLARNLNPECTYLLGDMRNTDLNMKFDAVVVFDSLAHMLSEKDLQAAFKTAFTRLKTGGLFCTYREFAPERFVQNGTRSGIHQKENVEIVLIENEYDPDPNDSTFENTMIFLIRRDGKLKVESQKGLIGLFSLETWRQLLVGVGFELLLSKPDSEGSDFFLCKKPNK
jgi:SAM-dependent methyltransferase